MPRTFKADLSEASLANLAQELRDYSKSLSMKNRTYLGRMSNLGEDSARTNFDILGPYPYATGGLRVSITGRVISDTKAKITAGTDHAGFIEFGTGVVGANAAKDPNQPSWWIQDSKGHGDKGWLYPADDGHSYITRGVPARPFMTNAANELRKEQTKVAKEVFGS